MALEGDKNNEKNEVLLYEGDGLMCSETLTKCKNSVCLIKCETEEPLRQLKRGTGFYAKTKVYGTEYCCVVTNHHVLSCEADARRSWATFHFEGENPGEAVRLWPDRLFWTNQELDYTVVGVNEEELRRINPPVLPLEYTKQPAANAGDDVFIFQHPQGRPKHFSYEKIIEIQPPYLFYSADTEEGSSGSPVLRKLCLMAVHQKGSNKCNYNKGTLFSEIVRDLHTVVPNVVSRKRGPSYSGINDPVEMEEHLAKKACVEMPDGNMTHRPISSGQANDQKASKCPDDVVLDKLSQECGGFYKHLGRRLGVDNVKIEEISKDHINYGSNPEKCFQVLHEWKESGESTFNYRTLETALRGLKKNALANKYCYGS